MKVVGVRRISGPKGKESDRIDPPSGGTTWQEGEVIYAQPCAAFDFVMELEPSLSADEFNSIKDSLSWSAGSGRITPDNADPRAAEHCAPKNSIWGWDWSAPVAFGMKGTVVTAASPFRAAPEVGYESAYELAWEVGFGEAGTADGDLTWKRSSSEHELYLTYNAEVPSYETVFHLSCTSANGKKTDTSVVDGVWSGFTGRNVKRKDGTELTYYKSYRNLVMSFEYLLSVTDGQCGAWAELFQETLKIQGIPSDFEMFIPSNFAERFLVKEWSFSGAGTSGNADFPHRNDVKGSGVGLWTNYTLTTQYDWGTVAEVIYTTGTRGQNNDMPASLFGNHQIVYVPVINAWYDPSYGMKHTTEQSIDNTLSGFVITGGTHVFFIQKNPAGVQIQFY